MFELVDRVGTIRNSALVRRLGADRRRTESRPRPRWYINYHGLKAHFATENPKESPHWMDIKPGQGRFPVSWMAAGSSRRSAAACKVEFPPALRFSSKVLKKWVGPVFHHIRQYLRRSLRQARNRLWLIRSTSKSSPQAGSAGCHCCPALVPRCTGHRSFRACGQAGRHRPGWQGQGRHFRWWKPDATLRDRDRVELVDL